MLVGPTWRALTELFAAELVAGAKDLAIPVVVDAVDAVDAAVLGARG